MNKIFFFAVALVVLLLAESAAFPRPLRTSMGLEHYAAQLEFYYQKPRPEKLRPIMAKLASAGVLDRADNRLLIAAFLSELARSGGIDLKKLFPEKMSRAQRHTLLWAARLASDRIYADLAPKLLADQDKSLKIQLDNSPSLEKWTPEPAVSRMRMAAFMAGGDGRWIDAVIDDALGNTRSSQTSRALLYDAAGRHARVRESLERRLGDASPEDADILALILKGAKK